MTHPGDFTPKDQADILLREYSALYGLIQLRLGALETRAMLAWAAFGGFVTGLVAVPHDQWLAISVATPPLLAWLFRTTLNHARSLEDALRRVEEVENSVNKITGTQLLTFQSTHPSRGKAVGGRTGRESVYAVFTTSVVILAIIGLHVWPRLDEATSWLAPAMGIYLALFATYLAQSLMTLRRYRYHAEATVG